MNMKVYVAAHLCKHLGLSLFWTFAIGFNHCNNGILLFCKYFLPICGLSSHSPNSIFCIAQIFNFNEVQLFFSSMDHAFSDVSEKVITKLKVT